VTLLRLLRSPLRRIVVWARDVGPPGPGDLVDAGVPPWADVRLRIAIAGDVGHPSPHLDATVAAMMRAAGPRRFDALVLLGDNVYPDGDPGRLDEAVLRPFAPVLAQGARLLPVLGNHDVQAGRADVLVRRLGMPGRWYACRLGDVLFVGLDSTRPDDREQQAWLADTLAEAEAAWTVVALHHPPYSAGWHGSDLAVRAAFEPTFSRFSVTLVLAGHEHDYQRSKMLGGTTYVISGAATHLRPTARAEFTATAFSTHHFLDLQVVDDVLHLQAVDRAGRIFDTLALPARTPARGR
jgi:3',5'-cyclic AMP phosphodiesterase CpdA